MQINRLTAVLCSYFLMTSSALAGSSLEELYELALKNDPELRIAEQRVLQADAGYDQAFGQLLPQISASAQLSDTDYSSTRSSYSYTGERYNLGLTQTLFDLSALSELERAEWEQSLQQASEEYTILERTALFVERYFDKLQAQSAIELSREELSVTEKNLERIESLFEKRLVSKVDRLDAIAKRDQLLAEIAQLEAQLSVATEMLAESVGDAAYTTLEPINISEDQLVPDLQSEQLWQDLGKSQSPILRANEARLKAAQSTLERTENDRLPKLSLRLTTQRTNVGSEYSQTSFNNANVISLNLSAPLYLGGTEFAKINSQTAQVEQSKAEYDLSRLRVTREIRNSFLSTRALVSSSEAAKTALESANTARLAAEKSFGYGITDVVALMQRISSEFQAEKQLNDTQYQMIISYVNLLRWSGELSSEDIQRLSRLITRN